MSRRVRGRGARVKTHHDSHCRRAARESRRTALILAASQAIVGSAAPIAISMGALAGHYLLGADKSLATAPVTGFNVGVALGALPAAAIIRRLGQRGGFMTGPSSPHRAGWLRHWRFSRAVSGCSPSACC